MFLSVPGRTLSVFIAATAILISSTVAAQRPSRGSATKPSRIVTYKKVGAVELKMHIFEPQDSKEKKNRPAIIFFFGGGWTGGTPSQFYEHCKYLASRGMVAMSAEYRVKKRHGTTPVECVKDGKSAVRWVREHAAELGVDPKRVAAGGGSAGGHVAAATLVEGVEEENDPKQSSMPDALVLFNPVVDTTPTGIGARRKIERAKDISPIHHVRKDLPPAIIFHGKDDKTVPYENVERFEKRMKEAGNVCELKGFEGKGHGFFNYTRDPDHKFFKETVRAADRFLAKHGFLTGEPTL